MSQQVLVIAHRGYSAKYPENTLRAFREALARNSRAIELDVHLSKDRELVVAHDFTFGRTVKAQGLLSDFTAAQLAGLDAGSFKGEEFKTERISKLSEVLALINGQCMLNIEIKNETLTNESAYHVIAEKLLAALQSYKLETVIFSSFDAYALKVLRQKSAAARIALLDDRPDRGPRILEAQALKAEAYNVNLKRISREQVRDLQTAGFKVFAYTVRSQEDLELARGLHVDGVFADNLEDAQKYFSA